MSRNPPFGAHPFPEPSESVKAAAQDWVVRQDRGLTPAETAEFHRWLAEDPLHAIAWEEHSHLLDRMDRLTVNRAVATGTRRQSAWLRWAPLLAAASVVIMALAIRPGEVPAMVPASPAAKPGPTSVAVVPAATPAGSPVAKMGAATTGNNATVAPLSQLRGAGGIAASRLPEGAEVRRLSDGSVVYLKAGAEFYERFSQTYRSVKLVRGEAMFDVAPNDDRLFVLTAGVRGSSGEVAVATAEGWFDVTVLDDSVETRIITGKVKISAAALLVAASRMGSDYNGTITEAGLIARIEYPSKVDSDIHVAQLAPTEITDLMAWKRAVETSALPVNLDRR
jgi:ferric-dicitrate binding protein FerR (iron transport regulator)